MTVTVDVSVGVSVSGTVTVAVTDTVCGTVSVSVIEHSKNSTRIESMIYELLPLYLFMLMFVCRLGVTVTAR